MALLVTRIKTPRTSSVAIITAASTRRIRSRPLTICRGSMSVRIFKDSSRRIGSASAERQFGAVLHRVQRHHCCADRERSDDGTGNATVSNE